MRGDGPAAGLLNKGLGRYFTAGQLEKLGGVRVGLAGTGGLGSNCAMLLARSGIKRFTLVDFDLVEPSNLNRQYFFPEHVGHSKVAALAEQLLRLDSGLDLRLHQARISKNNAAALFDDCLAVVEALDEAPAKAMLCNALTETGVFLVCASGLGGLGGPPMTVRRLGEYLYCVGDFVSAVGEGAPPLAPRVMQAAAMQADVLLSWILGKL